MKALRAGVILGLGLTAGLAWGDVSFSGSLSSSTGGISWMGSWTPITISWTVTENDDFTYHYSYDIVVGQKSISYVLLETSIGFSRSDIYNACSSYGLDSIALWNPGPGSPSMPSGLYGIKFEPRGGSLRTIRVEFDSPRAPVWGDIYLKDGTGYYAWNTGFRNPDTDPTARPHDGSEDHHILRPDTYGPIPEPSTFALVGLGLAGLGALRRRRRAKRA